MLMGLAIETRRGVRQQTFTFGTGPCLQSRHDQRVSRETINHRAVEWPAECPMITPKGQRPNSSGAERVCQTRRVSSAPDK